VYGADESPTLISKVTDAVIEQLTEWQARRLDAVYPIVYLYCIMVKIRQDKTVINKALYQVETHLRKKNRGDAETLACRATHAKPAVDAFFTWCDGQCQRMDFVPSSPFAKALKYVRSRDAQLRLYLSDPQLSLDTNHLERTLRVIPMGRKSWLFCWAEVGAERVGIIQSLLTTCRLHGVDPHTYLIDVLQRVSEHPASRVEELTPRVWKMMFADNPLRSDVYRHNVDSGAL
jgi:transposase